MSGHQNHSCYRRDSSAWLMNCHPRSGWSCPCRLLSGCAQGRRDVERGCTCGSLDWRSHCCPCWSFACCLSCHGMASWAWWRHCSPHGHIYLSVLLPEVNASCGCTYPFVPLGGGGSECFGLWEGLLVLMELGI